MAHGITETDVFTACDALLLAGQRPTIERVRQKIGRGSPNTVSPMLDVWFKSLGARLQDPGAFEPPPAVATPVQQAAQHFWEVAQAQARGDLEVYRLECLAAVETAQRNEQAARETMEAQVERIAQLTEQARSAEARAEALAAELAGARQHAAQAESALQERLERAVALADANGQEASRAMTDASTAKAALLRHEKAAMDEREQIRHAHLVELDRVRTDAKAQETRLRGELGKAVDRVDHQVGQISAQAAEIAGLRAQGDAAREAAAAAEARAAAAGAQARELELAVATKEASLAQAHAAHAQLVAAVATSAGHAGRSRGKITERSRT